MTWHTPLGPRKLTDEECRLISFLIDDILEFFNDDDSPLIFGPFQQLDKKCKITTLLDVAKHLFHHTKNCPTPTALEESAIWYIFVYLKKKFEEDLVYAETTWGRMIESALDATEILNSSRTSSEEIHPASSSDEDSDEEETKHGKKEKEKWRIVSVGCFNLKRWIQGIDILADNILWDRDFELLGEFGAHCSIKPEQVKMALKCLPEEDQQYYGTDMPFTDPSAKEELEKMIFPYLTSRSSDESSDSESDEEQSSGGKNLQKSEKIEHQPENYVHFENSSPMKKILSNYDGPKEHSNYVENSDDAQIIENDQSVPLPFRERAVTDQSSLDRLADTSDSTGNSPSYKKVGDNRELDDHLVSNSRMMQII